MKETFEAWIILNHFGGLWSKKNYYTKDEAEDAANDFWGKNKSALKAMKYKRAKITVEVFE